MSVSADNKRSTIDSDIRFGSGGKDVTIANKHLIVLEIPCMQREGVMFLKTVNKII